MKLSGKTKARAGVTANFILTPSNISGGEGELAEKYALTMDGASVAMAEIGLNKPASPTDVYLTAVASQPEENGQGNSSGGCNSGGFTLVLLAAALYCIVGKKA